MNHKIWLSLVAIPTLAGSMLAMTLASGKVLGTEAIGTNAIASCDTPTIPKRQAIRHINTGILVASSTPSLDFSEAESDAAVDLFGCDCSSCMNALRQLRSQTLLDKSKGHCWATLEQRKSPQEVNQILENLEAQEANSSVN
jgi:hypothetical protein